MNVGNLSEWMMSVPPWFWYVLLGLAVVTLVLFEIIMAQRYRRLTEVAEKRPLHAPVSIRGFISKEMDSRGATEYLHGQFREISETYRKMREKHGFLNTPVAIGKEFAQMMELASASLNLDPSEHPFYDDPSESRPDRTIEEDLKGIKLKSPWFEASASAIVNLVWRLIQKVPVRHRKRYRSLLFHVSVVSAGNRTQLRVSRQNRSALARSDANPADPVRSRNGQLTFTFSTEVEPADTNWEPKCVPWRERVLSPRGRGGPESVRVLLLPRFHARCGSKTRCNQVGDELLQAGPQDRQARIPSLHPRGPSALLCTAVSSSGQAHP